MVFCFRSILQTSDFFDWFPRCKRFYEYRGICKHELYFTCRHNCRITLNVLKHLDLFSIVEINIYILNLSEVLSE